MNAMIDLEKWILKADIQTLRKKTTRLPRIHIFINYYDNFLLTSNFNYDTYSQKTELLQFVTP